MKLNIIICLLLLCSYGLCQEHCASFQEIVEEPKFQKILADSSHQVQIIYTEIERKKNGTIKLHSVQHGLNNDLYFYPASTIKFPTAILAMQRLNELGLNLDHSVKIGADHFSQIAVSKDSSAINNLPSIGHYAKKIFLVSDNDAQNRLFEFLGPSYIHAELQKRGLTNTIIRHRLLGGLYGEANLYFNPFWIYENDSILYYRKGYKTEYEFQDLKKQKQIRGKAYWSDENQMIIKEAFDFSSKNYMSLEDLHQFTQMVFLPDAFDKDQQFNLTENDYLFLREWMSKPPRESTSPSYNLPDNYVKFVLFGDEDEEFSIPNHIKVYNKVGLAYGFVTDTAYVVDELNDIEFFLSIQLLVNENETFNDGIYEYQKAIDFMGQFGKAIYQMELSIKKASNQ